MRKRSEGARRRSRSARRWRVAYGRLAWAGPLAGVAAAAPNAVVYVGASALGAMPRDVVVGGRGPVTLGLVVANSFVPALLAALALALLGRFARRPVSSFRVLAAVVFVVSLAAPFLIAGAPATMRAALLLMHAVAAAAITGVLTALAVDKEIGCGRRARHDVLAGWRSRSPNVAVRTAKNTDDTQG